MELARHAITPKAQEHGQHGYKGLISKNQGAGVVLTVPAPYIYLIL
jgi:hypothetical protein